MKKYIKVQELDFNKKKFLHPNTKKYKRIKN